MGWNAFFFPPVLFYALSFCPCQGQIGRYCSDETIRAEPPPKTASLMPVCEDLAGIPPRGILLSHSRWVCARTCVRASLPLLARVFTKPRGSWNRLQGATHVAGGPLPTKASGGTAEIPFGLHCAHEYKHKARGQYPPSRDTLIGQSVPNKNNWLFLPVTSSLCHWFHSSQLLPILRSSTPPKDIPVKA